ncbi:MAG: Na/Pi cotransporter family protein [Desulfobulbus sp.]|nr:MAG: Na/Pi cotransporter family protein [Desulfobulbus sp.]
MPASTAHAASHALTAAAPAQPISWFFLTIGLFGGLAFFLYGMEKMSEGMKQTAGNRMRTILATLTRNRFIALFVGAFVTMVIQSSSATTVMLVSFVQAELMTFVQSLGVILGANIGTTITAQMVAFKLTDYALVMIIAGFAIRMLGKTEKIKCLGDILFGFGILFYGMKLMSDTMKPLRSYPGFISMMEGLENPFMGILAGAAFTALVQSSSASTGVVIVLAQQGLITLEAGIPVILGANIGTCITAALASIGTAREAKRVALAHVLFNVGGVLLFLFWIPQFADIVRSIASHFGSGTARQVANAHTLFNIAVGLIFLPFTGFFARFIRWMLPERPRKKGLDPITWHLDETIIETPAIALQLASAEIARMAKILGRMHRAAMIPFVSDKPARDEIYPKELDLLQGIEMRAGKIEFLEEQIRNYLLNISRQPLASGQGKEISKYMAMLDSMERIAVVITRQILPLIPKKQQINTDFSNEGKEELLRYHQKVTKQLDRIKQMMTTMDLSLAQKVRKKKNRYSRFYSKMRKHHLKRMLDMKQESVATHPIHLELMDALNQINIYSAEIAKTLLKNGNGKNTSADADEAQQEE